ncbi:SKP1-like protein 21 isoform X2 [Beta vulgaris subsp. vulgaris]|uniref:SKP1-like protein 21 isoform X2 n=1 Tax=Beta vulgaris subsp. vulgaris TaxID=3555 RepID=UPI0020375AD7|nr:SKP1-like protein 21 isoform X2 [Beta vulgaris subsp. vulgaris]
MSELDVVESEPSSPAPVYGQMMKSYIWLHTVDGSIQQVEQEVAMFCPVICHEIHAGKGSAKSHAICLPQRVNPAMLSLILDYCRFHQVPGHSNKERKSFDEKFIRMDTKRLCELASAADSLQLKPLVELTSRALARMIEGKTPEEIREIFCLPDDLTEEEKLEPLRNMTDDPRIRLLNRLYAKRRKELREKEKVKCAEAEEMHVDNRSVDDLLSFINGGDEDNKAAKTSKSKKKHRRRKDQPKSPPLINGIEHHKESKGNCSQVSTLGPSPSLRRELSSLDNCFIGEENLDDGDDDIDPVMKEQIDRFVFEPHVLLKYEYKEQRELLSYYLEVEDFTRRLNLNWSERMHELLHGSRKEVSNFIH